MEIKRFEDVNQLFAVVRAFEDASIARDAWKHTQHLTLALHYLSIYDMATATEKMRTGIFKLLAAFGVDMTKEMPYHETLTVFWMNTVSDFALSRKRNSLLNQANELIVRYDKDYPLKFYSREHLFSDEARARFVVGDLNPNDQVME